MSNAEKKVDPGWNDPPMLNYSPSNPPPKSRITNKRISFPLNTGQQLESNAANLPPVPGGASLGNTSNCDTATLKLSLQNFSNIFDKTDKLNEVKDKLQVLEDAWFNGKLSPKAQKIILEISQNLLEQNFDKIKELQFQLSMDNAPICNMLMTLTKYIRESQ